MGSPKLSTQHVIREIVKRPRIASYLGVGTALAYFMGEQTGFNRRWSQEPMWKKNPKAME